MRSVSASAGLGQLRAALESAKQTSGSTHNFYLYPARFSPELARAVIELFSEPGDCVLDPFMGGGTSIIEGLMLGRLMLGVDVNALACFVAAARTRPLSAPDQKAIRTWALKVYRQSQGIRVGAVPPIENLPRGMRSFLSDALAKTQAILPLRRQQAFARCALLRLGQWAVDCHEETEPSRTRLAGKLVELTDQFLIGLRDFAESCSAAGVRKNEIARRRFLLCRSSVGIESEPMFEAIGTRPRLVFTSPPYARVHVLYHRWQIQGRRETPAPYWIANVPDGHYGSHYTGGSRTPTGERDYFSMITSVFSSVAKLMAHDGIVVQLLGFANAETQLPRYLGAMKDAGFETFRPFQTSTAPLRRTVPNRKWYTALQRPLDASSEVLLFHRLRGRRQTP